jgi:hypothetical protein
LTSYQKIDMNEKEKHWIIPNFYYED